jgi:hypothetical protein
LGVGGVGENPVLEQLGENRCPLGAAGGTEASALAGESDEELKAALGTNDAGETGFEDSTIEVAGNGGIPEGSPESIPSLESLFPQALEALEAGLEELIEGGGARVARSVDSRTADGLGWQAQ